MRFLSTLFLCLLLISLPSWGQSFSLRNWKAKYAKQQPYNEWAANYAGPWNSWFGGSEEVAGKWHLYFGPLGIRVYAHDFTWSHMEGFKTRYPSLLTDQEGELIMNAFEVLHIIPGSPADGHLKEGDLLLEMDNQKFLPSPALKFKDGPYQFQESRSLEMHAGMLLDEAEARGKVTFKVLRPSDISTPPAKPASAWEKVAESSMMSHDERKKGMELRIPLKGDELCRLIVDNGGNGNGNDGFTWEGLTLTAPNGNSAPLHNLLPLNYRTGWGGQKVDKEKNTWWAHANSEILFIAPKGNWTLSGRATPSGGSTVIARIEVHPAPGLPPEFNSKVKTISFPIQKIGSYAADGIGKESKKKKNVSDMTAAWLAAQQNEDGSWSRYGGYTKPHYDTGIAGLGLLSTGDPAYNEHLKKAAEYIAFSGTKDWWGVPLSSSTIFLCEYWLRFKDNRVLPAIRNNVHRLINEMLYGDYVSGHGGHPGYRGSGVSVGGSHMALAFALAAKTPIQFDRTLIDKMLQRAQEIAPDGFVPYGRTTGSISLEPALNAGATYSGRHAPYLIASFIHGGPVHFTKNCRALYTDGKLGGADQGHSTETLTLLWTFPASSCINYSTYERQLNSFIWKLTMLRTFDGGFCWNANRTEYQGAEGLLNLYIRTGSWLLALNADKQNMAITGAPAYRAKNFKNVPPVADIEARILGTYKRNWAIVLSALGNKAPDSFQSAYKRITAIKSKQGCREALFQLIRPLSLSLAKDILKIQDIDPLVRAYCAEIVLGIDTRISIDNKKEDDKPVPGSYEYSITIQEPFSGRSAHLSGDEERESRKPLLPFSGTVSINDTKNSLSGWESFSFDNSKDKFNNWNALEKKWTLTGDLPPDKEVQLSAQISYTIGDTTISYERPIFINKFEPGNGEKGRTIVNDRKLKIPGIIAHDHGRWGISFHLPNNTFIAAASQGNAVTVHEGTGDKEKTWISPDYRCLTKESKGFFLCSTGWDALELRVSDVYLLQQGAPLAKIRQITANGKQLDLANLQDSSPDTSLEIESNDKGVLEILVTLKSMTPIRGVDIRSTGGVGNAKAVVSVENGRKWTELCWSSYSKGNHEMYDFQPSRTSKVKITLTRDDKFKINLSEVFVYEALPPKKDETKDPLSENKPQNPKTD